MPRPCNASQKRILFYVDCLLISLSYWVPVALRFGGTVALRDFAGESAVALSSPLKKGAFSRRGRCPSLQLECFPKDDLLAVTKQGTEFRQGEITQNEQGKQGFQVPCGPGGPKPADRSHQNREIIGEHMHQVALLDVFEASQMDSSQAFGSHQVCEDPFDDGGPLPDALLPATGPAPPAIGMESPALALLPMPFSPLGTLSLRDVGGDALIPVEIIDKRGFMVSPVGHLGNDCFFGINCLLGQIFLLGQNLI